MFTPPKMKTIFKKKFFVFLLFYIFNLSPALGQNKYRLDIFDIDIDNPWLSLKAIQTSYPDLVKNISFDSEVNDWFINIRNQNL